MRVIWNGMCDPTLHVIAIALLLVGDGIGVGPQRVIVARVRSHQEVPPLLIAIHYDANPQCTRPPPRRGFAEPDRLRHTPADRNRLDLRCKFPAPPAMDSVRMRSVTCRPRIRGPGACVSSSSIGILPRDAGQDAPPHRSGAPRDRRGGARASRPGPGGSSGGGQDDASARGHRRGGIAGDESTPHWSCSSRAGWPLGPRRDGLPRRTAGGWARRSAITSASSAGSGRGRGSGSRPRGSCCGSSSPTPSSKASARSCSTSSTRGASTPTWRWPCSARSRRRCATTCS